MSRRYNPDPPGWVICTFLTIMVIIRSIQYSILPVVAFFVLELVSLSPFGLPGAIGVIFVGVCAVQPFLFNGLWVDKSATAKAIQLTAIFGLTFLGLRSLPFQPFSPIAAIGLFVAVLLTLSVYSSICTADTSDAERRFKKRLSKILHNPSHV